MTSGEAVESGFVVRVDAFGVSFVLIAVGSGARLAAGGSCRLLSSTFPVVAVIQRFCRPCRYCRCALLCAITSVRVRLGGGSPDTAIVSCARVLTQTSSTSLAECSYEDRSLFFASNPHMPCRENFGGTNNVAQQLQAL